MTRPISTILSEAKQNYDKGARGDALSAYEACSLIPRLISALEKAIEQRHEWMNEALGNAEDMDDYDDVETLVETDDEQIQQILNGGES